MADRAEAKLREVVVLLQVVDHEVMCLSIVYR